MTITFADHRVLKALIAAAIAAGSLSLSGGMAQSDPNRLRSNLLQQRGIDLQTLESRERRQSYQDQQQILRELDRNNSVQQRQNMRVPRMRPGCQLPLRGNVYLPGTCY
ncbi:hypothetical protein KEU06_14765 [Pseudaminobacter sp. 19-2017]|uniref:Uncharacterized protein n=1 Tax=Pseudaminobacter soli (ex Zhang et al. 2022) TaxID=2831468 RepID=A0A942E7I8_9HYPH|nr:hypothetical protein [Pseudaminobacter soli]MBS3649872.1 hypothetical protein [Pseudaminobacter soli]